MRNASKLAGALGLMLAAGTAGIASVTSSHAVAAPTDDLHARRATLVAQLRTMMGSRGGASADLLNAEQEFSASQDRLLAGEFRLDVINQRLLANSRKIIDDQQVSARERDQLGALTRATYENNGSADVVTAVLSAGDFQEAMARLRSASNVSDQLRDLLTNLAQKRTDLANEQVVLHQAQRDASALEGSLGSESNQVIALVAQRNAALDQASTEARSLEAQIANVDQQIAEAATSGQAATGTASSGDGAAPAHVAADGPCGNHFYLGQCTYYVATKRCIPWMGNADQWYANAAQMGFAEGTTPVAGAVVVFRPGGDGAGGVGHVALVDAVGAAAGLPAGQFRISEMNSPVWNKVTYRVLSYNSGMMGFVYGKR